MSDLSTHTENEEPNMAPETPSEDEAAVDNSEVSEISIPSEPTNALWWSPANESFNVRIAVCLIMVVILSFMCLFFLYIVGSNM
jgi:hypothetical protein